MMQEVEEYEHGRVQFDELSLPVQKYLQDRG